jgi:hypothetical protein
MEWILRGGGGGGGVAKHCRIKRKRKKPFKSYPENDSCMSPLRHSLVKYKGLLNVDT